MGFKTQSFFQFASINCLTHAGHSLTNRAAAEPFLHHLLDDIQSGELVPFKTEKLKLIV